MYHDNSDLRALRSEIEAASTDAKPLLLKLLGVIERQDRELERLADWKRAHEDAQKLMGGGLY